MTDVRVRAAGNARGAAHANEGECRSLAIDVRDLEFSYPGAEVPVLRGLSWQVPEGAFVLLVGDTGSGKSTLLSLLKPEIAPTGARAGSICVLGKSTVELAADESARGIGYVFQNPDNQLVCESVWHEMAFGLENLGTPQGEMRRLVAETSYFFGMEEWFRQNVDTLSGGRKQLLALASTLVMQPRLLLLDEPTAQLDPIAEKNFLHALFRVNRELGCTVVVATHQPRAMTDYATCAFQLADGVLAPALDLEALKARQPLFADSAISGGSASARSADLPPAGTPKEGVLPVFLKNGPKMAKNARFADQQTPDVAQRGVKKTGLRGDGPVNGPSKRVEGQNQPPFDGQRAPDAPSEETPVRKSEIFSQKSCRNQKNQSTNPLKPAVEFRRAWFRYGREGAWVLRSMNLTVAPGRVHALVGGNGCGKSTLLSIMAGTQKLGKGSLTCGTSSRALLPQDPRALFAEETAMAELMEWTRVAGYGQRQAEEMLDELGLSTCASVHPYDLSGGQQQLLALGKLALTQPRLLLLDEPTKGLDLASRRLIAARLRDMAADGTTIVLAAHDLDFVSQVADDVSMIFDGEVACTSPREEFFQGNVYYRP